MLVSLSPFRIRFGCLKNVLCYGIGEKCNILMSLEAISCENGDEGFEEISELVISSILLRD